MSGDPLSLLAPGPVQPGIFNDPFGATHDRPEVQGFVDTMRAMLNAHGLTPDAFAARVFDGIRDGRYWLIPQPETIDGARCSGAPRTSSPHAIRRCRRCEVVVIQ
ncbi:MULTISPECIES: hypothetical protein [Burkholderia]|uniref:hypothetical protein n=1 Tax=Burkholderia TaxID=32008 RepID=UPI002010D54D|nr:MULTISPECIES: hypothetical protein [Burkholderia]